MFLRTHPIGRLFGADAGFRCFPWAPNDVRKPDVSVLRTERLAGNVLPTGYCPIAPDLAVEVVPPGDLAYEVEDKVADYLRAGVPLVWVVHPPTRSVRIHRPRSSAQGPVSELIADDLITGENVLPGLSCRVSEFFGQ
jgi:Uma2 family endonuclease